MIYTPVLIGCNKISLLNFVIISNYLYKKQKIRANAVNREKEHILLANMSS